MNLAMLRDEHDLARHSTHSLYADLPEADVYWRPALQSSGIGWHRGHQAAVNQVLVRNVLAAEPSLNPQFEVLFDAVTLEEQRGTLPPLHALLTYREAIARRTHAHLEALLGGTRPAAQQATYALGPLLVSLMNHAYQHACWCGRCVRCSVVSNWLWSFHVRYARWMASGCCLRPSRCPPSLDTGATLWMPGSVLGVPVGWREGRQRSALPARHAAGFQTRCFFTHVLAVS